MKSLSILKLKNRIISELKEELESLGSATMASSSSSEEAYREKLKAELKPFDAEKAKERKEKEKLLKDKKSNEADEPEKDDVKPEEDDGVPSEPAFKQPAFKQPSSTSASKKTPEPKPEPEPEPEVEDVPEEEPAADQKTPPPAQKKPDYGNNKKGVSGAANKPPITDDPNEVSVDVLVDLINRIKAGRSAKEESARGSLGEWLDSFLGPERLALRKYLEGLVSILVKNEPGKSAPKPSDPPVTIRMTSPLAGQTKKQPDTKDDLNNLPQDNAEPEGVKPKTLDDKRRDNDFFNKDPVNAEAPIKVQKSMQNRI